MNRRRRKSGPREAISRVANRFFSVPMAAQAKILIVDDERDLVDAYVRLLERSGYRCTGAFDANQAIQMIDAESPDLVITDLSLPDNSGVEIVRRVDRKRFGKG